MDGGKTIFFYNTLRHQNRVFEVVTVPRHKRDAHVLTKCQLAQINRRTVSQDVTANYIVTFANNWALVNTGVLVRTGVFSQVVNINRWLARLNFVVVYTNNNT